MLWKVKKAAQYLGVDIHQIYYLLGMGEIEAVKVGRTWRLAPEAVEDYDKRFPDRKNRKPSGNFIYSGNGGFLFSYIPDNLPPDPFGKTAVMERRRGQLVHSPRRSKKILLEKLKSLGQMELFTA